MKRWSSNTTHENDVVNDLNDALAGKYKDKRPLLIYPPSMTDKMRYFPLSLTSQSDLIIIHTLSPKPR